MQVQFAKTDHRICKDCLTEKPIKEFHVYSGGKSTANKCEPCWSESERKRQKALWANNAEYRERHNNYGKAIRRGIEPPRVRKIKYTDLTEKQCKICLQIKNIEMFPFSGKYRKNTCLDCYTKVSRKRDQERYRKDPNRRSYQRYHSRKHRWSKYGVTVEQVEETLRLQNYKCAIPACGQKISLDSPKDKEVKAVVDHDHATMKFRALLCHHCNVMLGYLEKNPKKVSDLQIYLSLFK